ncbi:hypothetical protein V6N12_034023 [Hibiscus sabdariffa]|uniref:Endonuclease/exonuclease/phosphatase domain-containing protein n=1 Tax=Hibiscus sabdariffa TaxID=183260 RepID=A0ABR2B499_9ROSI
MRFVIWNVRGLGTDLKLNAVKKLVREQQVQVLLLQETKKTAISEDEVRKLWVDEFHFRVGNAVGRSGGLLTLWDKNCFRLGKVSIQDRIISVSGVWIPKDVQVTIINIYASWIHCIGYWEGISM